MNTCIIYYPNVRSLIVGVNFAVRDIMILLTSIKSVLSHPLVGFNISV